MTDDHALRAFYACLSAICYLVTIGAILAGLGRYSEALGVGAAVTGLIGVIKLPSRPSVSVAQADQVGPNVTPSQTGA